MLYFILFFLIYPDIWDMNAIYDTTNLFVDTLYVDTILVNDEVETERMQVMFFSDTTIYGDSIFIEVFLTHPINMDSLPVIMALHGAGGSGSFEEVENYAAFGICGISISGPGSGGSTGPECTGENWLDVLESIKGSWMYQYAYAAMRTITLMRKYPFMDTTRVGVVGYSAGGMADGIISGVDSSRVKCSIIGISSGYWYEASLIDSSWFNIFPIGAAGLTRDSQQWHIFCDSLSSDIYASQTTVPMMWMVGSADEFFTVNAQKLTFQSLPSNHRYLTLYDYDHQTYYADTNGYYDTYYNLDSMNERFFNNSLLWWFDNFGIFDVSGLDTFYNPLIDTIIVGDSIEIYIQTQPCSVTTSPSLFVSYDSLWTLQRYEMFNISEGFYAYKVPYTENIWIFAEVKYEVPSLLGNLPYYLSTIPIYTGDSLAIKVKPSSPPSYVKNNTNRDLNNKIYKIIKIGNNIQHLPHLANGYKLYIYDISGRLVMEVNSNEIKKLYDLKNGIFLIKLEDRIN